MAISIREARRDRRGRISVATPQKWGSVQDWIDYYCVSDIAPEIQVHDGLTIIWYGNDGYVIHAENI